VLDIMQVHLHGISTGTIMQRTVMIVITDCNNAENQISITHLAKTSSKGKHQTI